MTTDRPIACSLSATDFQSQRGDLMSGLLSAAVACHEIDNGYRFTFAAADGTLTRIVHVLEQERRCCRFLRFELTVEPDLGPIRLDVTGPNGTAEFLRALLQL
jgi:hypothetical protein